MKTIEVAKATKALADYAKSIDRGAVLVLRNGKPLAVLSSAKGMDAESIALANNSRFVSIIEKSRARYKAEGGIPIEEVRRRLGLPAKKKRRKAS
jgi:PHD/YefM family antitoxin component YafN of YafNO toxin-antitoxin module